MNRKSLGLYIAAAIACLAFFSPGIHAGEQQAFELIVMDPLAAPLSCPCVEGYAQRKYEALASHLETQLQRKVRITFNASLAKALEQTDNRADLIVGKQSVVRADADAAKLKVVEIASLSDKLGSTKQHGLIVVRHDDAAQSSADLSGYEIIFGPAESEEKHAAAIAHVKQAGVAVPERLTIDQACSEGAAKVVEHGKQKKMAAVISSYAAPLLEGCGTIKKGDLRVIGKTKDVPFITAFANSSLEESEQAAIQQALFSTVELPALCEQLESLIGFVEPAKKKN
jgi:ABC-type phosphate/phosphonate transport system substrate-binding protein